MKKNRLTMLFLGIVTLAVVIVYLAGGLGAASEGSHQSTLSGRVVINEIMASNSGAVPAADGGFYDWIELYNTTGEDIDISSWGLSDDATVAAKWVFASGTVIPAHGYLVVWCSDLDQTDPAGELHTSFKLKAGQDTVVLSDNGGSMADAVAVVTVSDGCTMARNEQTGEWEESSSPTPGYSNDEAGRAAYEASMDASSIGLWITEVQSSNQTTLRAATGEYPDWIEVYNPTQAAVDLSGFGLSDDAQKPLKWTFPQGTVLQPGEYLVVYCDGVSDLTGKYEGELHAAFGLSSSGESAVLSNASGRVIDSVDFGAIPGDSSYARGADGTWSVTAKPTPGYENTDEGFIAFSEEAAALLGSGLIISEAMPSNTAYAQAEDGEYYDWIELYNNTAETIDLAGYGLSDNPGNPLKWVFPEGTSIAPGEYLVVQASGLNENDGKYIHTSFKLDGVSGEVVALSSPQGEILDKLNVGAVRGTESAGKETDGTPCYYAEPTPGEANGTGYIGYAESPAFETGAGFYYGAQTVTVAVPAGCTVYYTTDGSVPDESDQPYTGSLTVDETTTVRVRAYREGYLPSHTVTASYLIDSPHSSALSVVFLTCEPDDLFDEETGIYVEGPNPGSPPSYRTANYNQEWERAANIEIFDGEGNAQVNMELAVRMFGAFSRMREQKGFALIAREEYGADAINYPIFENREADSYHSIVLRAGGQDSTVTKIKDIVATGLVDGTTTLEVQAYRQAVLYVNGEYFGVYNIREKVNKYFIGAHYPDYDIENLDLLVGNGSALLGDNKAWRELIDWCEETDFSDPENYAELESKIDVNSYIDWLICEMYVNNTDSGNIKFFRERSNDPEKSKWKWIYYDFCWTFLGVTRDSFETFTNPTGHGSGKAFSNQLTISCMQSEEFQQKFLARAAELLNTIYTPENVLAKIEECVAAIEDEMPRDAEKWPEGGGVGNWQACVENTRNFARKRRNVMIDFLQDHFDLTDAETLELFGEKDDVE